MNAETALATIRARFATALESDGDYLPETEILDTIDKVKPDPFRAFVEQMARMTTPEDEFAEMQEQAPDVIAANEYTDADDMVADFSDDRLGGEYATFMQMVREARKLLA